MQTFDWTTHPQAEALIDDLLAGAVERSPRVRELAERLATETSTRLADWLDHVSAPVDEPALGAAGFAEDGSAFHHNQYYPESMPCPNERF